MKLHSLILLLAILTISCSSERFVEVKDDSGNLIEKYQVDKQGTKNGVYEYYVNELLTSKANYKEGILTGKRTIYYENGRPEIEENYLNGQLQGDYKVYYETGELKLIMNYKDNTIQGQMKKYYASGQLMEDVVFEDNEENGPFVEYWENGNLKWEGTFKGGDNEFGELKKYNDEGILIRKLMCDSLAVCRTFWTLEGGTSNEE